MQHFGTDPQHYGKRARFPGFFLSIPWHVTDGLNAVPSSSLFPPVSCFNDELAFIQFTSGSTGSPKGVMISHQRLAANLEQMRRACCDGSFVISGCSWLPQYHDMGLVGNILLPIFVGSEVALMSPTPPPVLSIPDGKQ